MKASDFIIILLVMGGITLGSYQFIGDISEDVANKTVTNYTWIGQTEDVFAKTESMADSYRKMGEGASVLYIVSVLIKGFLDFIGIAGTVLFSAFPNMVSGVFTYLYLPDWFKYMVSGIIMISVLFIIISAIIKWRT